ncbi:MAG TPA: LysM peptidoglycan-binding domain-containing protein [Candidatus Obscuribacterales bacterium]
MPIGYRPPTFSGSGGGGDSVAGGGEISHAGLSALFENAGSQGAEQAAYELQAQVADHLIQTTVVPPSAMKAMSPSLELAAQTGVTGHANMAGAHIATPTGLEAQALAGAHIATPTGLEAQALAGAPPPMDATALAAMANEPLSPLIQMIMRMPGAMGIMNSFFEALSQFFFGQGSVFHMVFDPTIFSKFAPGNMTTSLLSGSEHMPINMSLLPSQAPIFQSLHIGSAFSVNHISNGFHSSLSNSVTFNASPEHFTSLGDPLKVSGQLDLNKPQFEWSSKFGGQGAASSQGELISGPALSEGRLASHLGGTQRLFSDRITTSPSLASTANASGGMSNLSQATQPIAAGLSQSLPLANSLPSSLNAQGNSLAYQGAGLDAVGSMKDTSFGAAAQDNNVGFRMGQGQEHAIESSTYSATANFSNDSVIASNNSQETFRPTLGGLEKQTPAPSFDAQWNQPQAVSSPNPAAAAKSAGSALGGLKAKQLSLDSLHKPSTPAHAKPAASTSKPVMDHIGHQIKPHAHHHFGQAHDQVAHRSLPKVEYQRPQLRPDAKANEAVQPAFDAATASQAGITQQGVEATQAAGADAAIGSQTPTTYTIRAGDCLWNIAKNQLGDALKWKEIYNLNHDVLGTNPDLIHPGTNIELPGGAAEVANAGATTYVVKPGDSLWKISQEHFGDGTRWGELYKANAEIIGSNPRLILPGQELTIPGIDGGATVAQSAGQQAGQQLAQNAQSAGVQTPQPAQPEAVEQPVVEAQPQATPVEAPQAVPQQPQQQLPQTEPLGAPGAAQGTPISQEPLYAQPAPQLSAPAPQNAPIVSSSLLPTDILGFLKKNK